MIPYITWQGGAWRGADGKAIAPPAERDEQLLFLTSHADEDPTPYMRDYDHVVSCACGDFDCLTCYPDGHCACCRRYRRMLEHDRAARPVGLLTRMWRFLV